MRDGNNIDYVIDDLTNRYKSVGGSTLTYDAAGNLTKDKNGYTYRYDYENRLVKIRKSNDTVDVAEFTYDALGRRIEKKDNITAANTRRYYYNYNWQIYPPSVWRINVVFLESAVIFYKRTKYGKS